VSAGLLGSQPRDAEVRVPASSANLGGGFDCIAVAVDRWLTAAASVEPERAGPPVVRRAGALAGLAVEPERDALYLGFAAACRAAGRPVPVGLAFDADSAIPVARGLGSSAAALVAGAALANALLELGLDDTALVAVVSALEGHPENAAASVFGGGTLSVVAPAPADSGGGPAFTVSPLDVHESLAFAFAVPQLALETKRARGVLPSVVPYTTAVAAQARGAALVRGLADASPALLAVAFDDVLHVPHRRALVPGYDDVTRAAIAAGALGATLSGSGSTIVAVARREIAPVVAAAMERAWRADGVPAESFVSPARVPAMTVSRAGTAERPGSGRLNSSLHA
jgi:homoserine kinase